MPRAITSLGDLLDRVRALSERPRMAIASCAEGYVLRAAVDAAQHGIAEPVLIGDAQATRLKAQELGLDISSFELMDIADSAQAVTKAAQLYRQGQVDIITKGLVSTSVLLRAILNKEHGVPPEGILSHVTVYQSPLDNSLRLLSDAGVNISPTLQRKMDILRNCLGVATCLGFERPRVAILAATEKANTPGMPATLDADIIAKMAAQGEFGAVDVQGPLSLDLAVSEDSARLKGMKGPVAGRADVLIAPDINSGNSLYKALNTWCRVKMASVVAGSRVPLVVPSRADSPDTKLYSIALGVYLAKEGQKCRAS